MKYEGIYAPMYEQRKTIVRSDELDGFWLKVLKNGPLTSSLITDKDEPALRHLTDVKLVSDPHNDNFTIEFHFSTNPFFEN
jgi:hypothetical protein